MYLEEEGQRVPSQPEAHHDPSSRGIHSAESELGPRTISQAESCPPRLADNKKTVGEGLEAAGLSAVCHSDRGCEAGVG